MIAGATRGAGGAPLGRHLSNATKNETVEVLESRGLVSEDIRGQVAELTDMASHARTLTPLYHVHADPEPGTPWDDAVRARYWSRFEREFGFGQQPFAAVRHVYNGREHEHRVYKRILTDGAAIRLDHDYARLEKINRVHEYEEGQTLTPGAHNRAVIAALDLEGRHDIADRMRKLGFNTMARPRTSTTPQERYMQERTGILQEDVDQRALAAWKAGDSAQARRAALEEAGLRLAMGEKGAVLIDEGGGIHSLAKILGRASKAQDGERIGAAEVRVGIAALDLPNYIAHREDDCPRPGQPILCPDDAAADTDQSSEPPHIPPHIQDETAEAAPAGAKGPAEEGAEIVPVDETTSAVPKPVTEPMQEAPVSEPTSAPSELSAPVGGGVDAAPDAAGQGGGPVIGGGGGGGGPYGGDEEKVAALDPTRPDDLQRYLRQFAVAEARKAKRLSQIGDRVSKDAQNKAAEAAKHVGQLIAEFFDRAAEEHPHQHRRQKNVGSTAQPGYFGPDFGGHAETGGGSQAAKQLRPQGSDSCVLRSALNSEGRAQPARPPATTGSAAGGRAEQGRADTRAPGAGRREPGEVGASARPEQDDTKAVSRGATRDARGRPEHPHDCAQAGACANSDSAAHRLRKRRAASYLATAAGTRSQALAELIARLAGTPDRIAAAEAKAEHQERIAEAVSQSEQRIERVLSRAPYPDPASRDPGTLADDERARVERGLEEAKTKAQAAKSVAADAQGRIGILGRLGLPTAEKREASALAEAAQAAEDGADEAGRRLPDDLRDADRRAQALAEIRGDEQRKWEGSREVQRARREEHGNDLVREAIKNGDPEIERKAAEDLNGAREELLKREEKQRQERERAHLEREREREHLKKLEHDVEPELEHTHGGGPRGGGGGAPEPRLR